MKTNIFYDRKLWERWHELEGMEINTLNKSPQQETDIVCLPMNSRQDAQKSSVTKKKLHIVSGFPCQHHPWSQKQSYNLAGSLKASDAPHQRISNSETEPASFMW